jgi:hypothetical protein
MFSLLLLSQASESIWKKIVAEIPHSPAAILLYLVLAVCGYVLWRAHRASESE